MSSPVQTLGMVLRPVADQFTFITTTKVHSTLFPYPWASTLHAARISLLYQANMKKAGQEHEKNIGWKAYITGYLVMSWGGMLISHFLLGLPPPVLYSIHPYVNYLGVHLALTLAVSMFPQIIAPEHLPTYDIVLFPLDALLRVNAIVSTLGIVTSVPGINKNLVLSPLFHSIIGAVASAGGGVSAGTFGLWTSQWAFSTPVFLRPSAGWLGTLDLWAGSLIALIYDVATASPAVEGLVQGSSTFQTMANVIPTLSPLGAKALCIIVLSGLFGFRAYMNSPFAASSTPPPSKTVKNPQGKDKRKTQ